MREAQKPQITDLFKKHCTMKICTQVQGNCSSRRRKSTQKETIIQKELSPSFASYCIKNQETQNCSIKCILAYGYIHLNLKSEVMKKLCHVHYFVKW